MTLYLKFEPHSYYMGFAVMDTATAYKRLPDGSRQSMALDAWRWHAYTDNGNTYQVGEVRAYTLADVKREIRLYHLKAHDGYGERLARGNIKYLRGELQAERISTQELLDLRYYYELGYIGPSDVELLEAAGVPEFEGVK